MDSPAALLRVQRNVLEIFHSCSFKKQIGLLDSPWLVGLGNKGKAAALNKSMDKHTFSLKIQASGCV